MPTINYVPLLLAALATLELPELAWVVRDLLARGSLTLLAAREKGGKSLLAYYLAACVARGEPFLDRPVTPGPVLLVPAEEHLREVRDRLLRLFGDELDAQVHVLAVNRGEDDGLDLANPAALAELRRVIEELRPALVVLDPFRELHGEAENDADAMGPLLRPLRLLAHETDTAIVLVHHMSRGGNFRGSTAILAACDQEWALRGPDEATDESAELRGTLTIKGRFGPKQSFGIRLAEDGRWEVADRVAPAAASARQLVLAHLRDRDEPATAEEIAGAIGVETKTTQNIVGDLHRRGAAGLVRLGTGRKGDAYRYLIGRSNRSGGRAVLPDSPTPSGRGNREARPAPV